MFGKLKDLNTKFVMTVAMACATIECTYLFLLWSLIPLAFPITQTVVFYVSGGVLQLVLLPLILFSQRVLAETTKDNHDELSDKHDMTHEALDDLKNVIADNKEELALLSTLVESQQLLLSNQKNIIGRINHIDADLATIKAKLTP